MKILSRNSIALLLVFTIIFTLGAASFTDNVGINSEPLEIFSGDDKTVAEDVYGEEDIDIGGGGNIGDIDIVGDGGGSTVTGDVYGGPTTGALTYTIKYYFLGLDGALVEGEMIGEVDYEKPEVTVEDIPVPVELPEGYVIDEENSMLPFIVTEDDNVIMVYYLQAIKQKLEYVMNYYFVTPDGEEVEGAINGEVGSDDSILTIFNIPTPEEVPEGYVVDEELSTLPFEVSEENIEADINNNVIDVYYVSLPEEGAWLDNMPPTEHPSDPTPIMEFEPGSLGSALDLQMNLLSRAYSTGLAPGEVRTSKTATPVQGMVNTWDITVRVEGKDNDVVETTDVVLVIDRSGSMDNNRRMENAKTAAINFINTMIPRDLNLRVAIVSFSSSYQGAELVEINQGFTNDTGLLTSAVNNLAPLGGTHTQAGIIQGRSLLDGSNANNKYMVLLSDGEPTYSYEPSNWSSGRPSWGTAGNINASRQLTGVYDGSFNTSTIVGTGSDLRQSYTTGSGSSQRRRHIDNGAAATKAGQDARVGIDGLFTIAVEAGTSGTSILNSIASPGMAYSTQNPAELQEIYDRIGIEIATQSAIRNAVIVDEMGDGFSLISGTLNITQGNTIVAQANGTKNQEITWTLGSSVTKLVPGATNIRYAEMTYRVEINDKILDIDGAKTDQDELFETNKFTKMTYTDINDKTTTTNFTSPEVDPVLLKIKKILVNPTDSENRRFNVKISKEEPNSFNRTVELVPNADYVWLTSLRHEGTYNVEEISITGNGIINIGGFDISYEIDGEDKENFLVNHTSDGIPRSDVVIEVTNKQFGEATPDTPLIRISKTFSGLSQEQINQLNSFKITITSQSDPSRSKVLLLDDGVIFIEENGDITYKWEIEGWPAGTYNIDETGEELENYDVITENGGIVTTVKAEVTWNPQLLKKANTEVYNYLNRDGISPNLVATKLTTGEGVFIWTETRLSVSQRLAVIAALSGFNELGLTADNGFWYSGQDIAGEEFYFRGNKIQYNLDTGVLHVPQPKQWALIISGAYKFEGGDPADIGVKNSYTLKTTNVIIEKEVTGNFGDLTRAFAFTVIVDGDNDNPHTFNLSHNESKTLENIPKDAILRLTEESANYDIKVKIGDSNIVANEDGSYTIDLSNYNSDITISVTNHKDVIIDTGISMDSMPYILILSLATIGLGTGVVRKKNIEKEE